MNIIAYRYRRRPRRRVPFTAVVVAPSTKAPPVRQRANRWRRLPPAIAHPQQQRFVFTKVVSSPLPPAARRRVRWPQPKIYWRTQQRTRFVIPGPRYTYRQITLYDRSFSLTVEDRSSSVRLVNRAATITVVDLP